jgi:hypothetical protein
MHFGVDYGSFETNEDHAKDITTSYGYDHMVGYFDEHGSHSVAYITMWHPVFVNIVGNPCHVLHSQETASDILEEVGMTSSQHGPYGLGYTCATMAITIGSKALRRSESRKIALVRIVLCNSRT